MHFLFALVIFARKHYIANYIVIRSNTAVLKDSGVTRKVMNCITLYTFYKMLRLMTGFEDKWRAVAGESFKLRRLTRLMA